MQQFSHQTIVNLPGPSKGCQMVAKRCWYINIDGLMIYIYIYRWPFSASISLEVVFCFRLGKKRVRSKSLHHPAEVFGTVEQQKTINRKNIFLRRIMFYPPGMWSHIPRAQLVCTFPWVDDRFLEGNHGRWFPPLGPAWSDQRFKGPSSKWMAGNLDLNKNPRNFRIPMPTPLQDITKALLGDYVTMMVNKFYFFSGGGRMALQGFPFNSHHKEDPTVGP